uniref:GSKIP domain-containing protein n=1 Tax=Setaria digitata TaxID=48799 RepID=A0A915PKT7_9BILA
MHVQFFPNSVDAGSSYLKKNMAHSPPFTPPSSPSCKNVPSTLSFHAVHPIGTPTANCLADSLGVSPLYRQQDSARWQSAAQIYQSYQNSRAHSRAHSPAPDGFHEAFMYPPSLTPALVSDHTSTVHNIFGTPLSLVEIGRANRKRHAETGDALNELSVGGPLELEAIAAVHELSNEVRSIAVSEILPRTADLIFVNIKTVEGHPYTLELTMKGWRIASLQCDSMNGDYKRVELHAKYYENARQLLEEISPAHSQYFTKCLTEKLAQLHIWRKAQEEMEDVDVGTFDKQIGNSSNSSKNETKHDAENDDLSDEEGLVFNVGENSNR